MYDTEAKTVETQRRPQPSWEKARSKSNVNPKQKFVTFPFRPFTFILEA